MGEEKGTKTGRERAMRMIPALRLDLRTWWLASGRPDDGLVFPMRDGRPWSDGKYRKWRRLSFKPALERAGLDRGIRVYDLRHAHASHLLQSGMTIVEVAERLGHDPATCLSTYAHVVRDFEGQRMDLTAEVAKARSSDRVCDEIPGSRA